MKHNFTRFTSLLGMFSAAFLLLSCSHHPDLPRPENFEAARYLGKWHEVARLPVFYQPDDTLATAEYGATGKSGRISVYNQSYDRAGSPLKSIRGTADLMPGEPPGRFKVRFPGIPSVVAFFTGPNYHVLHVSEDYRYAVVGVPSRKALWILSREVPVPAAKLAGLTRFAADAGFDTSRLIVAPWK